MDKQATLENVYNKAFQDELQKIGFLGIGTAIKSSFAAGKAAMAGKTGLNAIGAGMKAAPLATGIIGGGAAVGAAGLGAKAFGGR